jgi:DNA-binding NarL/FixJ family response regulator
MSLRVLIMDDQPLVRAGLLRLFEGSDIQVCAQASTMEELVRGLADSRPTLVIGEIRLGEVAVLDRLPELRAQFPDLPILFYSASDNPVDEAKALAEGANGYLSRSANREELLRAVRRVGAKESLWTGADQRRLSNYLRDGRALVGHFAPLTPREQQILKLLTTGATNREISNGLEISHETVKEHVQHVLKKIGVSDRTQAADWAVRNGLA